jgi:hypothetical protein
MKSAGKVAARDLSGTISDRKHKEENKIKMIFKENGYGLALTDSG